MCLGTREQQEANCLRYFGEGCYLDENAVVDGDSACQKTVAQLLPVDRDRVYVEYACGRSGSLSWPGAQPDA